jgi:L-asparaginase
VAVRVLTTGGTIAQLLGDGEARHVPGNDLVAVLQQSEDFAGSIDREIQVEDLFDLPSTYIGPDEMLVIAERVAAAVADPAVEGVVVTHGTATLEETVYFVEIVAAPSKPVVFTGAQRFPESVGYDGSRNLDHAMTVAASPAAAKAGTVLVMDGEIHAARDVVELDPSSTAGFQSPAYGPIGRVESGKVTIGRLPIRDSPVTNVRGPLARVDLLTTYAGMPGDVVLAVGALGARGLVIEGMTTGAVPRGIADAIGELVQRGIIVAVGTRCAAGGVVPRSARYGGVTGYGPELARLGIVLTELSCVKARCRLIALLSSGLAVAAVRDRMRSGLDGGPEMGGTPEGRPVRPGRRSDEAMSLTEQSRPRVKS